MPDMINTFQQTVHDTSFIVLGVVLLVSIIGLLKPRFFLGVLREFSERRYIFIGGTFLSLLCGTIFISTQTPAGDIYVSESTQRAVESVKTSQVNNDTNIQALKIEELKAVEPIAHPKKQEYDSTLEEGQKKIIQVGKDGQKTKVYNVTYDKNKEILRVLKNEIVAIEPVPEIMAVGTKPDPKTTQSGAVKKDDNPNNQPPKRSSLPSIQLSCTKDKDHQKAANSRTVICLSKQ